MALVGGILLLLVGRFALARLVPDVGWSAGLAMARAEEWTIYALDPDVRPMAEPPQGEGEGFHRWGIRGSTTLTDAKVRRELTRALNGGIAASDGWIAMCFNPRHGIRVRTEDGPIDLVICFECLRIDVHGPGDAGPRAIRTTEGPREVFDRVFEEHGLSIAPRRDGK